MSEKRALSKCEACYQHGVAAVDFGSKNMKFTLGYLDKGRLLVKPYAKKNLNLAGELESFQGHVSKAKIKQMKSVLLAFLDYCKTRKINKVLGVGTSALRNARNRKDITDLIRGLGIEFSIVRGKREGELAYLAATIGKPGYVVTDFGSRSFQVAFTKNAEILSQSMKCGYYIAFERFYKNSSCFIDGHRQFQKVISRNLQSLPHQGYQMSAITCITLACHVTQKNKQEMAGQYLYAATLTKEIERLRSMSAKAFQHYLRNTPKIEKILPGLTFIDHIMALTSNYRTRVEVAELPVGLIVEYFQRHSPKQVTD